MKRFEVFWNAFFSKKFQGIGVILETDCPQGPSNYITVCVFTMRILWFTFWIKIDKERKKI
jgi:hypothetical protein